MKQLSLRARNMKKIVKKLIPLVFFGFVNILMVPLPSFVSAGDNTIILGSNCVRVGRLDQQEAEGEKKVDKVHKIDGTILEGKVLRITETTIEFDPIGDTPFIPIPKLDVLKVVYADDRILEITGVRDLSRKPIGKQFNLRSNHSGMPKYQPPENETSTMGEIGLGLGVPYGVFGSRFSVCTHIATLDVGFGILPFAWEPQFSAGVSLHIGNRYATVRPKLTAIFSTAVTAVWFLEEGSFETIYDEIFPGIGTYFGFDYRLGKREKLCIDINVGWLFPFIGKDEVRRKWEEATNDLERRGYIVDGDSPPNLNTPKLSIGLTYSFGRSLKLVY